jgi:PAS domain S-box-containing protein
VHLPPFQPPPVPDAAAQAARHASDQRFRDLIDAIPNIAVQGYDHRLICRFWNAASERLYGYSATEAIGASLLDLIIPAALRDAVVQATSAMLATGQAIPSAELELRDKQGRPVHVHSGHVLLQRPGQAPEFFCIDFDLGERRQGEAARRLLEAQLREMQKMEALGTLAGGIAHDFNNIVAAILGNVNLAIEDTAPDSPALTSLLEIQKAGRRARALTQQILTFARRQEEQREPVAPGPLVQELRGVFRTTLPPGTRLAIEVEQALPSVLANAPQLQQVLINLVANAVQACMGQPNAQVRVQACALEGPPATPAGGLSVLQASPGTPQAGVLLSVQDNGAGMTPETAQRIFEPFFTTKAAHKGTGLGLSVVHGILRDHNATLQLLSAPGEGSCFRVWLAALPPDAGPGSDTDPR